MNDAELFRQFLQASQALSRAKPPPIPRAVEPLWDSDNLVVVDWFAGGGGASAGIRQATGRSPIIAVNHNEHAIRMHTLNHPATHHICESVHDVHPSTELRGRDVDLLWASPDCTHFSKARGGKPVTKEIRGLAWVISNPGRHISGIDHPGWAQSVRPRVIIMENVEEFRGWGPLHTNCTCGAGVKAKKHKKGCRINRPIKRLKGTTFRPFVQSFRDAGYEVQHRVLNAAHYGAPTSRKRLFLIARRDGHPIVWPEPTHGPGRTPFRTAAECIDWSLPSASIFLNKGEAKAWTRKHGGGQIRRPLARNTMRRIATGIGRYVLGGKADPFIVRIGQTGGGVNGYVKPGDEPLSTVTSKNEHLLVCPSMVTTGYGERPGQLPRALDMHKPLGTVVAGGTKHNLVSSFLESVESVIPDAGRARQVAAFMAQHNRGAVGRELQSPLQCIAGNINKSLVTVELEPGEAAPHLGRAGMVAAFLTEYYGNGGQWSDLHKPMNTAVGRARFSLVTVEIDSKTYVMTDVCMRMLAPRELARAQGFEDNYVLTGTKVEQIARLGNSVCPPIAKALVEAQFNLGDYQTAA